ncbi:MAG: Gfo/Idh/MocA family protein [Candidatus Scatosoma sp.]
MDGDIRKLRVGIIGCGRISVMHLIPLQTIKEAEVVACCDIKRERAEETAKKYGLTAYESYEEMLDKENLDCVHICLPHYLHSKAAICAFEHGVNVLCEKPMDVDYESAERAVRIAKEKGVLYGVIFQCRYNNSAQLVKKAVESGRLGKILSARSTLTWTRPDEYYAESDWKGTWDKEGGGVIIDQAIHSIDLVNWMVGSEAESVSVSMANRGHKCVKVEDSAEGLITYKNGVKYGFYAMMMLAACMMFGLLARTYMRRVAVNAVLFTLAGMVVIQFCGAFFSLLIWEYEGGRGYFLRRYLPMCVYTAVSAVPCYYLVRLIHSRTDPQKSDRPID